MNKAIMECCICDNYKKGEFIIINEKKYHLSCIEKLQKEKDTLVEFLEYKVNKLQIQLNEQRDTLNDIDRGIIIGCKSGYEALLEWLRSGKYE